MAPGAAPPAVPTKDSYDPLSGGAMPPRSMGARFAAAFRRQTSEEKEIKRKEKERRMRGEMSRHESKSSRMDVIDKLDMSGIHGSSSESRAAKSAAVLACLLTRCSAVFHHDSPYDACSPHANRNMRRAPVGAFDASIDPMTGKPYVRGGGAAASSRPGASGKSGNLSELAQGTLRKMSQSSGLSIGDDVVGVPTLSSGAGGARDDDAASESHSIIDRDVEAERNFRSSRQEWGNEGRSGRSDAANPHAEIWGVASEPWQDFAAPAARPSRSNGKGGLAPPSGPSSRASSVYDMEAVMTGRTGGAAAQGNGDDNAQLDIPGVSPFPERDWGAPGGSGEGPKRSKSLIKRIKVARRECPVTGAGVQRLTLHPENPNVPAGDAADVELAALDRPAARRGYSAGPGHRHSPSSPPLTTDGYGNGGSGVSSGVGNSLGRSGTLRPRAAPRENYSPGVTPQANGEEASDYTSAGGAAPSSGAGVARNNSIFGRFGKGRGGKGAERGEVAVR
jgi:hypothetical protein